MNSNTLVPIFSPDGEAHTVRPHQAERLINECGWTTNIPPPGASYRWSFYYPCADRSHGPHCDASYHNGSLTIVPGAGEVPELSDGVTLIQVRVIDVDAARNFMVRMGVAPGALVMTQRMIP